MNVDVHGAEIFVRDEGGGPPVLLLHGNPDSSDLWDDAIRRLRESYRCLAPDLPGFGRSSIPPGFDFRLASMSSFVDGLMTALGVAEPVRLVVHDFGGPYGLSWAVEHPERVSRIVVVNSIFSTRLRWHFWARIWRTRFLGEASMLLMNRWLFARELRRGSLGHLSREHVRRAYSLVSRETKSMVLRLYRATDPECFAGWEERLAELARTVPIKVLWARQDPYLDVRLAHTFGTEDIDFFDTTGHWLPIEAAPEMSKLVSAFFALRAMDRNDAAQAP